MKNFTFGFLAFSFLISASCAKSDRSPASIPAVEETTTEGTDAERNISPAEILDAPKLAQGLRTKILSQYSYLDPKHLVPRIPLERAVLYYDTHKDRLKNKTYFSVVDFSAHSGKHRFFLIHVPTGQVWALHVAHGSGSDSENRGYASRFSNKSGSNASSLGYYTTGETYSGNHGLSLRLDGKSASNSNVRARAVVIHGANYVGEQYSQMGRSWGCLAVAQELSADVVNRLKNGSLIYAWVPGLAD